MRPEGREESDELVYQAMKVEECVQQLLLPHLLDREFLEELQLLGQLARRERDLSTEKEEENP